MAINFASKASPKVMEAFTKESLTEGIFSKEYDWTGVATVRIYSVDTLPMQDYDWDLVDGTSRFGSLTELGDTYQELTVNQDKSFNGAIDKRNNNSTLMIKAAAKSCPARPATSSYRWSINTAWLRLLTAMV